MKRTILYTLIFLILLPSFLNYAADGKVTMPLREWKDMHKAIEKMTKPDTPKFNYCPVSRSIKGTFRKGLFKASLKTTFKVLKKGHIMIPVIDGKSSLQEVLLNGHRTSLYKDKARNMFFIAISKPGTYTLDIQFFIGKELERFERSIACRLPEAGPTKLSITIPENNIEAKLEKGVLTSEVVQAGSTYLEGNLDASGNLSLSWTRKVTHRKKKVARTDTKMNILYTIQEAVVSGLALYEVKVLEGEIDRFELIVPEEIEIIRVEGDAVLQWQTDNKEGRHLKILLRYYVEDNLSIKVFFQFPIKSGQDINISMPHLLQMKKIKGVLGIQADAGLNVKPIKQEEAEKLELRDLPSDLAQLTDKPLLLAYRFADTIPEIQLSVTRFKHLKLTSTLIDDMEVASVITEDGLEITKIKMRVRNNTRQYLTMKIPPDVQLTYSLINGRPIRPAIVQNKNEELLYLPLQQSERIRKKAVRYHIVRDGDTLSSIAYQYYGSTRQWRPILRDNEDTIRNSSAPIVAGQKLTIPYIKGPKIKEKSFVIELAYKKNQKKMLDLFGLRKLKLPKIDIDTMKVTWHFYFPQKYEPLLIFSNLNQLSHIRYDSFRRFFYFLQNALIRKAWAGEGYSKYQNILRLRKSIYRDESVNKYYKDKTVLATFPLVGKRYRFKKSLLRQETPVISLFYMSNPLYHVMRWLSFVFALCAAFWFFKKKITRKRIFYAVIWLAALLVYCHFFLGTYRRLILVIDLALFFIIIKNIYPSFWKTFGRKIKYPWKSLLNILKFKRLMQILLLSIAIYIILAWPMLLSLWLLLGLSIWWYRIHSPVLGGGK